MEERIKKAIGRGAVVRRPPSLELGDYSVFAGAEAEQAAQAIRDELGEAALKVEVVGKGFVNIILAQSAVNFAVSEAVAQGEEWGAKTPQERGSPDAPQSGAFRGQRVIVEYTDPNPFKEMHIGHLMSNTIGESISRLIGNESASVVRACYSGDVGPHVAKALWQLQKEGVTDPDSASQLSAAYVAGNRAYDSSPEAKLEIDSLNTAVYKGIDTSLMGLWQKGKDIAMEAFKKIFTLLGTHFDYYFFESEVADAGIRIVRDGVRKGIFEESEGAVIYRAKKEGMPTLVFITSRGTPTYEAKEIGLAFLKEERTPNDQSIILTGTEQIGHFNAVLSALTEVAPLVAAKTTHVPHGLLRLTTGKMSSRGGNVITAEALILDMITKASEKNEDALVAEQVAIGAIKYMVLRQAPGSDITFDPDKSLSLEGDSGPYLQYALVRARKILAYAGGEGGTDVPDAPYAIERLIVHYPEVVARAARELAPNILTTYLTELAAEWNHFYATEQVLGSPEEAYKQRVARAFANTMTNGLRLLGIPAPERM